jgi:hypothetical protein
MAIDAPENTAKQAIVDALTPFASKLDPAAASFLPDRWAQELAGKSPVQIVAEVTNRLNSGHFAGFFKEGMAPSPVTPVAPLDPSTNVKAILETMGGQLQPGAQEQILKLMPDLAGLAPSLIREVLAHRLGQRDYQHFVVPPAPRYAPGSVEEFAQRIDPRDAPGGVGNLGGSSFRHRVQPLASGMKSSAPATHPAERPMESYAQMKTRIAAIQTQTAPGFVFGQSVGLGGQNNKK